ncbi:MAG: cation transporter [Thermoplasmata archaeon]
MVKKKVNLKIYGMTCEDCAITITKHLNEKDGVKVLNLSFLNEHGTIIVDTDKISAEEVLKLPIFSGKSHYRAMLEDDQK